MTDLLKLVDKGRVAAVARAVSNLDAAARERAAADLLAHVRAPEGWWVGDSATALAVATVGCAPSAARAAAILGRRTVFIRDGAPPVLDMARARGVTWLAAGCSPSPSPTA